MPEKPTHEEMRKALELLQRGLAVEQGSETTHACVDAVLPPATLSGESKSMLKQWPAGFDDQLKDWKVRIEAKENDPNSMASFLLNSIHRMQLALQTNDKKKILQISSLARQLSVDMYAFFKEEGLSGDEEYNAAKKWAEVFERLLEPKGFRPRIAMIGEPKDSGWMTYPAGGTMSVQTVNSWAICNTKNGIAHEKALIDVLPA